MKPVYQTFFGDGVAGTISGNCMQASVASILELPLEEVPHFEINAHDWSSAYYELNKFLSGYGLSALVLNGSPECYAYDWPPIPGVLHQHQQYLVCGKSPRGFGHMCVGEGGARNCIQNLILICLYLSFIRILA